MIVNILHCRSYCVLLPLLFCIPGSSSESPDGDDAEEKEEESGIECVGEEVESFRDAWVLLAVVLLYSWVHDEQEEDQENPVPCDDVKELDVLRDNPNVRLSGERPVVLAVDRAIVDWQIGEVHSAIIP